MKNFMSSMKKTNCKVRPAAAFALTCILLAGCAVKQVDLRQALEYQPAAKSAPGTPGQDYAKLEKKNAEGPYRWTRRVITDKELLQLEKMDAQLTRVASWEILGRLNVKSAFHISRDIKGKTPLKVPLNFSAYKTWTPLPETIWEVGALPKFILIIKDIPFLGWYEKGRLVEDTQVCIGKKNHWTRTGLYSVLEKDRDHVSQSYSNAMGAPAAMPLALKVYGNVWVHAGDVIGGYCSHGCVNLPWATAEELYEWADLGTPVLISDSMKKLNGDLKRHSRPLKTPPRNDPSSIIKRKK